MDLNVLRTFVAVCEYSGFSAAGERLGYTPVSYTHLAHLPATMLCTGVGLAISVALGLLLAIVMDASPAAERMLYPLIIASQTIPTTALAPLFVLWFGYTIWSKRCV